MTASTQERESRPVSAKKSRCTLSRLQRRTVLTVHILAAGIWIGTDVLTAILVGVGLLTTDEIRTIDIYNDLGKYILIPTLNAALITGIVCLASGWILSVGTKWGLLRFWWVSAKFALNIMLCVGIVIIMSPVSEIAAGQRDPGDVRPLFVITMIAITLLVSANILSIFKPWGRIRRRLDGSPT